MSNQLPVEEWFQKSEATKILVENLKVNLKALAPELPPEQVRALLRTNLIMIRQCMQDCGFNHGE